MVCPQEAPGDGTTAWGGTWAFGLSPLDTGALESQYILVQYRVSSHYAKLPKDAH